MVYIASSFDADEILCNVPAHCIRANLKDKKFVSDLNSEEGIVDANDNGLPIKFVLLGFVPFFGNLGMRQGEEFLRIAFIGLEPKHRLLPPRCVSTLMISGKSSQKSFYTYFQELHNNRINCSQVITAVKFAGRSFTEKDPLTGADKGKINYNVLEFNDLEPKTDEEMKLVADITSWMAGDGVTKITSVLKAHISGANLIELPMGEDHDALKREFIAKFPPNKEAFNSPQAALPAAATPVQSAAVEDDTTSVRLTKEQAKSLGLDV